jgi:hypothetical protein
MIVCVILLFTIGCYFSRKEKNGTDCFLSGGNAGGVAIGPSPLAFRYFHVYCYIHSSFKIILKGGEKQVQNFNNTFSDL